MSEIDWQKRCAELEAVLAQAKRVLPTSVADAYAILDAAPETVLAAHDAETVRVTAEKAAQIADSEGHLWSGIGAAASFGVAIRISATFGLAPDEKGGA